MRIAWLVVTVLCLARGVGAQVVSEMTPETIRAAIADAKTDGCYTIGSLWEGDYGCFTTPYSRVVLAAKKARSLYRPISEVDITADLIAPGELRVTAWAEPVQGAPRVRDVEAIVIAPKKSRDPASVIHPLRIEPTPVEFKNLLGATLDGKSLTAVFPLSVLSEAHEVRVVYSDGYERIHGFKPPAKTKVR